VDKAFCAIVGGILVHYRGRQHVARAKAVGPDMPLMDSQPKVLYLRVVLASMQSAPLVVLRAGSSPGLLWEMEQAVRTLEPQRLLIFVWNIRVQDYNLFANQVKVNFGLQLPPIDSSSVMRVIVDRRESPGKAKPGFVAFESDWSAMYLPLPSTIVRTGYKDFSKAFRTALRPLFERHGLPCD
jgi:hypothetical protein